MKIKKPNIILILINIGHHSSNIRHLHIKLLFLQLSLSTTTVILSLDPFSIAILSKALQMSSAYISFLSTL